MELDEMLDRCRGLEDRAAALYRSYAAGARGQPELCALWTALAREEESHARSLAEARERRSSVERVWLDGWAEALEEVGERLAAAERVGAGGSPERQLTAALELEATELEAMRLAVLAVSGAPLHPAPDHSLRLADEAVRLSDDPQVRLAAALLRARTRLAEQTA